MIRLAELLLIVCTAVAGFMGLDWYIAVPVGVAGLSVSALPKYFTYMPRARKAGVQGAVWAIASMSALNSLLAVGLAYLLGASIAYLII